MSQTAVSLLSNATHFEWLLSAMTWPKTVSNNIFFIWCFLECWIYKLYFQTRICKNGAPLFKTVYIFPMHHLDIWELNSRCRANALRWLLCRIFYFSAFQITFNLLLQSSISEVCYRWQPIKIIGTFVADSFSSLIESFYF